MRGSTRWPMWMREFMCAAGSVLSGRTRRRQSGRNSHALPRPRDSHPYKTFLSSALTVQLSLVVPCIHLSQFPTMAQVIVVGGGLAGLSAAHTLLERGANVLLLDKQP